MSHGKQFTLYTHIGGPNGWKLAFILEELGLTYESIYLDFTKGEQKAPEDTKYNPNGRIPTLIDHQNGEFVVWESNTILLYLIKKYDTEKRLTVTDEKESTRSSNGCSSRPPAKGILFHEASSREASSAVTRYQEETKRVLSVLDSVLAATPSGFLVGDKLTIADLSFITWKRAAYAVSLDDVDIAKGYPAVWAWHSKLVARESVKKLLELQDKLKQQ